MEAIQIGNATGDGHPTEQELQRFVGGELSPTEVRVIVRHLLRGCPDCSRITRRLWNLGEPGPQIQIAANRGSSRLRSGHTISSA